MSDYSAYNIIKMRDGIRLNALCMKLLKWEMLYV